MDEYDGEKGWLEAQFCGTEAEAGSPHSKQKWQKQENKARKSATLMKHWRWREGLVYPKVRGLRSGLESCNLESWSGR